FVGVGAAKGLANLQHSGGLHDGLDARGIVHAGQLDQDLVLPQTMFFDHRFAHAQLVNAVADGFDSLLHRPVLELGELRRLHGNSVGILGAGRQVVLRQIGVDDVAQVGTVIRRNSLDDNVVGIVGWVGLGDVGKSDVPGAQGGLEALNGLLGIHVHRIINLHLQDEVGAAFEVQAKVNAL